MPDPLPIPDALTQLVLQNPPRSAADMRRMIDGFAAFMNADLPEVGAFHEGVSISEGVSADVVVPKTAGPHPVVVYLHGGGWICGSARTHRKLAFRLAEAGFLVLNVDYRLAPEHPFPAAPEDCYAAARFVAERGAELGVDPSRIAIGGDSAGGNLTAVVAQMARDRRGPRLRYQLLVYPVTDARFDTASYRDNAEGYFLTTAMMKWFWKKYLADPMDAENPYASPLRAKDLAGLPPGLCITAEYDPLRDEGEAYAERLRESGVDVAATRYDGMFHGFFGMGALLDQAKTAVAQAAEGLRKALA